MREAAAMGRPRGFDEREALNAITAVFWAKGFEGASTSDLVAATGLKKGSLYAAFGDKQAMYLEALRHYDREWISGLVRCLSGDEPPMTRIERFLQSAIEGAGGRRGAKGCFLCNAAVDQAPADAAAKRVVKASLARLEGALVDAVSALPAMPAEKTAQHLLSVYFGLRVLAKGGAAPADLRNAKQSALEMLTARSKGSGLA